MNLSHAGLEVVQGQVRYRVFQTIEIHLVGLLEDLWIGCVRDVLRMVVESEVVVS